MAPLPERTAPSPVAGDHAEGAGPARDAHFVRPAGGVLRIAARSQRGRTRDAQQRGGQQDQPSRRRHQGSNPAYSPAERSVRSLPATGSSTRIAVQNRRRTAKRAPNRGTTPRRSKDGATARRRFTPAPTEAQGRRRSQPSARAAGSKRRWVWPPTMSIGAASDTPPSRTKRVPASARIAPPSSPPVSMPDWRAVSTGTSRRAYTAAAAAAPSTKL